jgi:hypothetical protein
VSRYIRGVIKKESAPAVGVKEAKPKKVKPTYSIRDVIKQNYRELIEKEIPFESNDNRYLGSYQRAVTTVLNEMSDEDREEAEAILELWNEKGGPSDVQLK